MSEKSDKAKLESVLDYIQDIDTIIKRHETIENALLDMEGQYALLMCIQQIGELVNKIESDKYISKIPVKDIVGFRNVVAHNYDGINFRIVENVLGNSIPDLKKLVEELLNDEDQGNI
jgi:uncharacterized protein with HEPN domain